MITLTTGIGAFIADSRRLPLSPAVLRWIRTGFVDCIGVMVAGRDQPVVNIVAGLVDPGNRRESRLLLGESFAPAGDAALVNGTAAHALDYDDVALAGHPSAVLVPALLAEGEARDASGEDIARAYLVGYEVWADLFARDADQHHQKGWHPTAVFGTVAVAAAIAALHRLDETRARSAIAIAASMAGGVVANFGTMTKPFHAGRAAQAGLQAARLAAAGMTGAADALEHPLGFLKAISPAGKVDLDTPCRLGEELRILRNGLNVKKYPLCYATHRSIDGMLDLVNRHDLKPDDVVGVAVGMSEPQAQILRNHAPQTGLDAKFSEEFAIASALVARRAGLGELTDSFVRRPEIQAVMPRVSVHTVAERDPDDPVFSAHESVVVTLADGRRLDSGPIRYARGHANLPLRDEDLWMKFGDCLADAASPARARQLFDQLNAIETLPSIRALAPLDGHPAPSRRAS